MTMHVVLGDGEMTRRELTETLADLWKADEEISQPFWFLIQGKSEPTDTDKALVTWLEKNEIYYEVVADDPKSMSEIYSQPQDTHTAKKISQKVVALMQSKPDEDETAEVLALFSDVNDATASEDGWLNGVIQAAFDAGFVTRALNDGLVEVDLSDAAAAEEAEPEATPPGKPLKTTKKVAKKADTPVSAEGGTPASSISSVLMVPSREELEDMEPSEIKDVAAKLGIVLPPRTRATTYIEHILGDKAQATPVAVEDIPIIEHVHTIDAEAVSTNGYVDPEALAEQIADILWERIRKVFTDV
jgi:hypothetical protein